MRRRALPVFGVVVIAVLAVGLIVARDFDPNLTPVSDPSVTPVAEALNVLPFPGTPDASPWSQIIFPVLGPSQLNTVTAQGSRSGRHSGQLSELPHGRGTAFLPDRPFAPGERVSVRAALSSPAAGIASGARGAAQITFSFMVATPPVSTNSPAPKTPAAGSQSVKPPATQTFHSRPDLHPPVVTVSMPDADPYSGYVFVDAYKALQNGPMILDGQGHPVWFHPLSGGDSAFDVRVQSYQSEPVLTWWQGRVASGHGFGEGVILNTSYQPVATVHAGEGYQADLHEFLITPRGSALIPIYQPVQADLTSVGGARNGTVFDSIIQEVDIKTGRVLWEWHALGHVPLGASHSGKPTAGMIYDFFHINSIQETSDGNLIVSARNTWAVYKINRSTGMIAWQLGGKNSSFKMGPGTQFEWQHDARLHADGTLTLFDNAAAPPKSQSRAIRLRLDTKTLSATLVSSYAHTPPLLAGSQGNMQVLPDGNVFVGWGAQPNFSEFTPNGRLTFDGSFPAPVQSYRAYRHIWNGQPADPPSISVSTTAAGHLTVYASWNGATHVARWELLGGPTQGKLSSLAATDATGFETAISIETSQRYLAVRALSISGQILGTSATVSH